MRSVQRSSPIAQQSVRNRSFVTLARYRRRLLELQAEIAALQAEIPVALQKLDSGTYGECERCHLEIDPHRLARKPTSGLCKRCEAKIALASKPVPLRLHFVRR
jgi:RNA polymerase-binding transcription factor DksA